MKKILIFTILSLAILLTGCATQTESEPIIQDEKEVLNDETSPSADVEKQTETKAGDENKEVAQSGNISISGIKDNDTLISPALIEGEADIASNMVIVELRNNAHEAVSSSVEAAVHDGKYKISEFWFQFKNTQEGFVAVYDKDDFNNLIEVPVSFQTVE